MKIIISGSNSQIARELKLKLKEGKNQLFFFDKEQFNLLNFKTYEKLFHQIQPDIFINTSAYTNVNEAENNYKKAYNLNAFSLKKLSFFCNFYSTLFIHFSTDYVFNGLKENYLYRENDFTDPKTLYGRSKLKGELITLNNFNKFIILRISWLYSPHKKNFIKFLINQAYNMSETNMIDDSFSLPTGTINIIEALKKIINIKDKSLFNQIFHLCDAGDSVSPFELSKYVFRILSDKGIKIPNLHRIKHKDFNSNITRPIYSSLDNNKIKKLLKIELTNWKVNVYKTIDDIVN